MRLLVVEDAEKLARTLKRGLEKEGYAVDTLGDGRLAQTRLRSRADEYDLVVLDVMLPGVDGFTICRDLRERGLTVPVLMLTARDTTDDKVTGLDSGADDYLVKPFAFEELLARVRTLLRRPRAAPCRRRSWPATSCSTRSRARRAAAPADLELTTKEFALLELLMRHPGEVLSRERILDHVWDDEYDASSNVIDVHLKNLRRKVDGADGPSLFQHGARRRLLACGRMTRRDPAGRPRRLRPRDHAPRRAVHGDRRAARRRLGRVHVPDRQVEHLRRRPGPRRRGRATRSRASWPRARSAACAGSSWPLDGAIIVAVGALGFWYARRTLHPIRELYGAQKRFVADASHELRTPLAIMKADFEVALRGAGDRRRRADRRRRGSARVGAGRRRSRRRSRRRRSARRRCSQETDELREAVRSGLEEVDRMSAIVDDLLSCRASTPTRRSCASRRSTWRSSCATRPRPCARWASGARWRWR